MKTVRILIFAAHEDGSESKVEDLTLAPNLAGEFILQDHCFKAHEESLYLGATIAANGNIHIGLTNQPFYGLSTHIYTLLICDCMSRLAGPPAQVIVRLRPQKIVRIFVEGLK